MKTKPSNDRLFHIDSSGVFECPFGSACKKPHAGEVFDTMLEALEKVTERLEIATQYIEDETSWQGREIPDEIVDNGFDIRAARSAIAKAKGGE